MAEAKGAGPAKRHGSARKGQPPGPAPRSGTRNPGRTDRAAGSAPRAPADGGDGAAAVAGGAASKAAGTDPASSPSAGAPAVPAQQLPATARGRFLRRFQRTAPTKAGIPVLDLEGVGPVFAQRLQGAGIHDTEALLRADPQQLAAIAEVPYAEVRKWQDMSELLHVSGIGPQFAEVLVRCDVNTVAELAQEEPDALARRIQAYLASLRSTVIGVPVTPKLAKAWVKAARRLAEPVRDRGAAALEKVAAAEEKGDPLEAPPEPVDPKELAEEARHESERGFLHRFGLRHRIPKVELHEPKRRKASLFRRRPSGPPITVECANCQHRFEVAAQTRQAECPKCQSLLRLADETRQGHEPRGPGAPPGKGGAPGAESPGKDTGQGEPRLPQATAKQERLQAKERKAQLKAARREEARKAKEERALRDEERRAAKAAQKARQDTRADEGRAGSEGAHNARDTDQATAAADALAASDAANEEKERAAERQAAKDAAKHAAKAEQQRLAAERLAAKTAAKAEKGRRAMERKAAKDAARAANDAAMTAERQGVEAAVAPSSTPGGPGAADGQPLAPAASEHALAAPEGSAQPEQDEKDARRRAKERARRDIEAARMAQGASLWEQAVSRPLPGPGEDHGAWEKSVEKGTGHRKKDSWAEAEGKARFARLAKPERTRVRLVTGESPFARLPEDQHVRQAPRLADGTSPFERLPDDAKQPQPPPRLPDGRSPFVVLPEDVVSDAQRIHAFGHKPGLEYTTKGGFHVKEEILEAPAPAEVDLGASGSRAARRQERQAERERRERAKEERKRQVEATREAARQREAERRSQQRTESRLRRRRGNVDAEAGQGPDETAVVADVPAPAVPNPGTKEGPAGLAAPATSGGVVETAAEGPRRPWMTFLPRAKPDAAARPPDEATEDQAPGAAGAEAQEAPDEPRKAKARRWGRAKGKQEALVPGTAGEREDAGAPEPLQSTPTVEGAPAEVAAATPDRQGSVQGRGTGPRLWGWKRKASPVEPVAKAEELVEFTAVAPPEDPKRRRMLERAAKLEAAELARQERLAMKAAKAEARHEERRREEAGKQAHHKATDGEDARAPANGEAQAPGPVEAPSGLADSSQIEALERQQEAARRETERLEKEAARARAEEAKAAARREKEEARRLQAEAEVAQRARAAAAKEAERIRLAGEKEAQRRRAAEAKEEQRLAKEQQRLAKDQQRLAERSERARLAEAKAAQREREAQEKEAERARLAEEKEAERARMVEEEQAERDRRTRQEEAERAQRAREERAELLAIADDQATPPSKEPTEVEVLVVDLPAAPPVQQEPWDPGPWAPSGEQASKRQEPRKPSPGARAGSSPGPRAGPAGDRQAAPPKARPGLPAGQRASSAPGRSPAVPKTPQGTQGPPTGQPRAPSGYDPAKVDAILARHGDAVKRPNVRK